MDKKTTTIKITNTKNGLNLIENASIKFNRGFEQDLWDSRLTHMNLNKKHTI